MINAITEFNENITIQINNNNGNETTPTTPTPTQTQMYFGKLTIRTPPVEITDKTQYILFTIDRSSSMKENGKDGQTKLYHVKNVFKNMLEFLAKQTHETAIYIGVQTFDTDVEIIIPRVRISPDNVDELVASIWKIEPRGFTNIQKALVQANKLLRDATTATAIQPQMTHIFMTDGSPTIGCMNFQELNALVASGIYNDAGDEIEVIHQFIGIGLDHNSHLLHLLGENKNGEYYFIDNAENAGVLYGELLHRILYISLFDVVIKTMSEICGGGGGILLYDWKTNEWVNEITEKSFVGDAVKTYHVASQRADVDFVNEMILCVHAWNRYDELEIEYVPFTLTLAPDTTPTTTPLATHTPTPTPLECYVYRQKVLEMLYKSKQQHNTNTAKQQHNNDNNANINPYNFIKRRAVRDAPRNYEKEIEEKEKKQEHKKELKLFYREMKQFMKEKGFLENVFMLNLCNDIEICYNTFDTTYGHMFSATRQSTQANEMTYNVSDENVPLRDDADDGAYDNDNDDTDNINNNDRNWDDDDDCYDDYNNNINDDIKTQNNKYMTPYKNKNILATINQITTQSPMTL